MRCTRRSSCWWTSSTGNLANQPFGPYDHISEAVNQLLRLRKTSGKEQKAARLESCLEAFAAACNSTLPNLLQWRALIAENRRRDAHFQPFDQMYLQKELEAGNPDSQDYAGALTFLMIVS